MNTYLFTAICSVLFLIAALTQSSNAYGVVSGADNIKLDCNTNCTEIVKMGPRYMLLGVNRSGEIFYVEPLNIPAEADYLSTKPVQNTVYDASISSSGSTVESTEQHYRTDTEIIVVTTYRHYNANGDLVDVQVNVVRFPHGEWDPE